MNKISTSEEFLNDQGVPLDKLKNLPWFDYGNILTWLEEYSDLKAKYHVKAALEAAANNVYGEGHQLINGEIVPLEKSDGIIFHPADQPYPDLEFIINPDSILNAYPESNIK